jgi:hypothetical protein
MNNAQPKILFEFIDCFNDADRYRWLAEKLITSTRKEIFEMLEGVTSLHDLDEMIDSQNSSEKIDYQFLDEMIDSKD